MPVVDLPLIKPRVPIATLRYDPVLLALRDRRMLGRPHGGTVVVHFLKRNEWFLETALALLGRHKTWDSGIEAEAYAIRPVAESSVSKVQVVLPATTWNGVGVVDLADARWGIPRMWGSPIVRENGYISEGREVIQPVPPVVVPSSSSYGSDRFKNGTPKLGYADPPDGPNFNHTGPVQPDVHSEPPTSSLSLPEPFMDLLDTLLSVSQVSTTTTTLEPLETPSIVEISIEGAVENPHSDPLAPAKGSREKTSVTLSNSLR